MSGKNAAIIIFICLVVLLIIFKADLPTGLFSTTALSTDSWWQEARGMLEAFRDGCTIADDTARFALPGALTPLYDIRREFYALDVPSEMAEAKQAIYDAMSATIDAYRLFLGSAEQDEIDRAIEASGQAWEEAGAIMREKGLGF